MNARAETPVFIWYTPSGDFSHCSPNNEVAGEVSREMRFLTSKDYRVCFKE